MGKGLKSLGCRPKEGKLVCDYNADGTRLRVAAGQNENGEIIPVDTQAEKGGVDPEIMKAAIKETLVIARTKKDEYGEFSR